MVQNDFKRTCKITVDGLPQSLVSEVLLNVIQRTPSSDDYSPSENIFPTGTGIQITGAKEDGICKICKRFEEVIKNKLKTTARMNKTAGYLDFGYCAQKNLRIDFSKQAADDKQDLINMFISQKLNETLDEEKSKK